MRKKYEIEKKAEELREKIVKNYGKWKDWKRHSFGFYLVLFVTAVVLIAVLFASGISDLIAELTTFSNTRIILLWVVAISICFGLILSYFVGRLLLKPIAHLQEAMDEVANGNLEVKMPEENRIDEIENINHSFNIMVRELGSTQEMQKDFISNVSHEFKTPLSAIEGYAMLLQDKSLSESEREEYTEEIISTTRTMTELVTNILLLSRVENQAIAYEKEEYQLDEQIREVVVMLEPQWSAKEIEFDAELDEIKITENRALLMNVWRNLIENAVKFTPVGSKITITLTTEGENAIFTVTDEGEGVNESEKSLIFNKFYQSDTSRKQQGNGLGLPLVKKILEITGGSISVENIDGAGCRFTVKLPRM